MVDETACIQPGYLMYFIIQITISSKEHLHNRIRIPDSPFTEAEDPTG